MTLFNLDYLLKILSSDMVILGVGASTYESGGGGHSSVCNTKN